MRNEAAVRGLGGGSEEWVRVFMWLVYEVENRLGPLVEGICDTLLNHCEKDVRIYVPFGPNIKTWFSVGRDTAKTESGYAVRVHGFCGVTDFRFRSNESGFAFAVNNYKDAEHIFYQFVSMLQVYRGNIGLECLDIEYIFDIKEYGSPPVTSYNYAAITGVDIVPLQEILHSKFPGTAHREVHGRYCIYVYSNNASGKFFNQNLLPLCQKLLDSFTSGYFLEDAMLFCVIKSGEQHIYFSVKGAGLFYCTGDRSRDFLVSELTYLIKMLSLSPMKNGKMAGKKTEPPGGAGTSGGGKPFTVPDELMGIAGGMFNTFVQDCEKNARITVDAGRGMWFQVEKTPAPENEKDTLRVRGGVGPAGFRFYADGTGAGFEADGNFDAENLFFMFIYMIRTYRNNRGLAPLDTAFIDRLAEEDSPPVSAENYVEITPDEKTARLAGLITQNFMGMSVMENYGQLCFYICSEAGKIKHIPFAYIPVYIKLLNAFKTAFSVKSAMLLAVRWSGKQRLFFIDDKKHLFCCKHDGSREFFYERFDFIMTSLNNSPNGSTSVMGMLSKSLGRPIDIKELNDIFDGKAPLPSGWRFNTGRR